MDRPRQIDSGFKSFDSPMASVSKHLQKNRKQMKMRTGKGPMRNLKVVAVAMKVTGDGSTLARHTARESGAINDTYPRQI